MRATTVAVLHLSKIKDLIECDQILLVKHKMYQFSPKKIRKNALETVFCNEASAIIIFECPIYTVQI